MHPHTSGLSRYSLQHRGWAQQSATTLMASTLDFQGNFEFVYNMSQYLWSISQYISNYRDMSARSTVSTIFLRWLGLLWFKHLNKNTLKSLTHNQIAVDWDLKTNSQIVVDYLLCVWKPLSGIDWSQCVAITHPELHWLNRFLSGYVQLRPYFPAKTSNCLLRPGCTRL